MTATDTPRTVTTVAEFDALPVESVIRRGPIRDDVETAVAEKADDGRWWLTASRDSVAAAALVDDDVPYTVLYLPEPECP